MRFEDVEIPDEIEKTLYVHICLQSKWENDIGKISVHTFDRSGFDDDDKHVLLVTKKIKIKIPKTTIDFRGELVVGLEAQKEKELAEHYMRMKAFQDRIDNLLAIEYKPEKSS